MRIQRMKTLRIPPEIIKFIIVGGISFLLDYVVFLLLYSAGNVDVRVSGMVSFALAFIVSFFLQKQWTFHHQKQSKQLQVQLIATIALAICNLFIAAFITKLLIDSGLPASLARPLVFGGIMLWNFTIYKKVIFR